MSSASAAGDQRRDEGVTDEAIVREGDEHGRAAAARRAHTMCPFPSRC
jgi:hypothetical protein